MQQTFPWQMSWNSKRKSGWSPRHLHADNSQLTVLSKQTWNMFNCIDLKFGNVWLFHSLHLNNNDTEGRGGVGVVICPAWSWISIIYSKSVFTLKTLNPLGHLHISQKRALEMQWRSRKKRKEARKRADLNNYGRRQMGAIDSFTH